VKARRNNRKKIIVLLSLAILGMAGGFWWGRGYALRRALGKAEEFCQEHLHAELTYATPKWVGLGRLRMEWMNAKEGDAERLVVQELEVAINYWGWLSGGKKLREVRVKELRMARSKGSVGTEKAPRTGKLPALPAMLADLPSFTLWLPPLLHLEKLKIQMGEGKWLRAEPFSWVNGDLRISFDAAWTAEQHLWQVSGHLDPTTLESSDLLVGPAHQPWKVTTSPLVKGDTWKWKVEVEGKPFQIQHNLLSAAPLLFPESRLNLLLAGDGKSLWFQEGSTLSFKDFELNIGGSRFAADSQNWELRCAADRQSARDLMAALPQPSLLPSLQVRGEVDFAVEARLPKGSLDDLDLHISRLDLSLMPDTAGWQGVPAHPAALFWQPFEFRPERSQRVLRIDRNSSGYTRLAAMTPFLPSAVLVAEDPHFRAHRGVDTTVLRKAIADNLADGKFSRGGSTITMQLVKNTHLTRSKDLYRKLNQVLLASMVENTPGISKDDILEMYLNLIEWGPEKYGIREASAYFFAKQPSMLTLDESLFLACIIPNPQKFRSLLDENGQPTEATTTLMEMIKFQLWESGELDDTQLDAPVQFRIRAEAMHGN
jgi:hypothetical protein